MKKRLRILNQLSLTLALVFIVTASVGARASADEVDEALTTPTNPVVTLIPACKGIPIATQKEGLKLVKSAVCTDLVQLLSGTQTSDQIGNDIQAVYTDLQTDLSLTPLCAASLMGVLAQRLITGKISAGFCPSGG
jgi:hypothetical protein